MADEKVEVGQLIAHHLGLERDRLAGGGDRCRYFYRIDLDHAVPDGSVRRTGGRRRRTTVIEALQEGAPLVLGKEALGTTGIGLALLGKLLGYREVDRD